MANTGLACQKSKVVCQPKTQLASFPLPNARFDHIHLDVIGPMPPSKGNFEFLLTIVDRYSQFPLAVPMRKANVNTIINFLIDCWWAIFGLPKTFTTYRGTVFTSAEFSKFNKKYNICHQLTPSYHPQSNGLSNVFIDVLKKPLHVLKIPRSLALGSFRRA